MAVFKTTRRKRVAALEGRSATTVVHQYNRNPHDYKDYRGQSRSRDHNFLSMPPSLVRAGVVSAHAVVVRHGHRRAILIGPKQSTGTGTDTPARTCGFLAQSCCVPVVGVHV